jgi:hypothetical protein
MQRTKLYKALISQGNDVDETIDIMEEMRERVLDGENPDEVLYEFGLEPDYVMDILADWITIKR